MRLPAVAALLVLGLPALARGDGIELDSALAEMGVALELPANVEAVPVVPQSGVDYQVAYRPKGARYEVRVSLFPESYLSRQSGYGEVDKYVPLFSMGLLAGIAGDRLYFSRTADLPGPTVLREFGADTGMTVLVNGNNSDFSRGHEYVALVFLYKKGKGVAVMYFLYDDPKDLEIDGIDFSQAYYSLRFTSELRASKQPEGGESAGTSGP